MQLVQQVTTFPMEDEFEYEGCAIYNIIVELIMNYPSNGTIDRVILPSNSI